MPCRSINNYSDAFYAEIQPDFTPVSMQVLNMVNMGPSMHVQVHTSTKYMDMTASMCTLRKSSGFKIKPLFPI